MRGMRALQRVGLLGEVGVSNYSLDRWRAAEQALGARVLSNQVRYSLVDRSPERDLLPFAESTGHLVIAYSPLAQGLLAGTYDRDHRPANRLRAANPLFIPENLDRAGDLIATLRKVRTRMPRRPPRSPWPGASAVRGGGHTGRLQRRPGGEQRRRRRHRADRGRVPGPARGGRPVPPVSGPAVLPRLLRSRFAR